MLVDDKQAREKMAKVCEDKIIEWTKKWGNSPGPNGRDVFGADLATVIRQTDLSDCKVEIGDASIRINDLRAAAVELEPDAISDLPRLQQKAFAQIQIGLLDAANIVESLSAQVAELKTQYHELLYGVARKFPGETRHQTALRYINNAETVSVNSGCAAAKESGVSP